MALQIQHQTELGPVATEAFAVITSFEGTKETIKYWVQVYWNKQFHDEGKNPIAGYQFEMPLNLGASAGQIIADMYADLKTRPGFENAIDV